MRKIKFIIGALLIAIALVFIGEIYVWHIESFEGDYPYTTMYLQRESSQPEMINDICEAGTMYDVEVFTVVKKLESLFSQHIYIYAMKRAIPVIGEKSDIIGGKFGSIFLGKVEISILPFDEIPDISSVEAYYLIGSDDNIVAFKRSLVNSYAGRFPEFPASSNESQYFVMTIWIVVFILLLLLTLYEIAFLKKEIMIRIISGENIYVCIFKNILINLIFYILFISISMRVLNKFTNAQYCMSITFICSLVFLVINSIFYLKLRNSDYKKDIATNVSARRALSASYVLKTITVILVITIMSGSIGMILKGLDFYRQSSFFKNHQQYSYLTVNSGDFNSTLELNRLLYKKALHENKTISLADLGNWSQDADYILADRGALDYLKSVIPEIKSKNFDEKVYYILSDENVTKPEIEQGMVEIWESYYKGDYDYEIITYEKNIDVLSIENIGKIRSTMKKNPVIILNNMSPNSIDDYWNIGYITNSTMYDYSAQDLKNFMYQSNLEKERYFNTNVYDNYNYQWQVIQRNLIIGLVLLILILILEDIVITTILRFEYNVNATELSLKKVLGYSPYERHKKIMLYTVLFNVLSIIGSVIVCNIFELAPILNIMIGGFIIVMQEIIFIIYNIRKMERWNIQRILKGERI